MARRMIDGVERVAAVFRNIPRESQEKIAHALNLGGQEIAQRARLLAPVGAYMGGGDLRESVKVRATEIRQRRDDQAVAVYVVAGSTLDTAGYARQQEFGRAPSPDGHPGHAAQPFLFPAYFSVRNRVRSRVKRAVKAAAKAAGNA